MAGTSATAPGRRWGADTAGVRKAKMARQVRRALLWLLFAAIAASVLYPLFFLTATSLRSTADYVHDPAGLPAHLTFANFSEALNHDHIARYALNSLLVVLPAVVLITVLSILAAYALVHLGVPFGRLTLVIVVGLMAVPPTALLIPVFKVILDAGLLNQRLGLILVYTALNLPFSIYLLASFLRGIPTEVLEAARIDGAGPLRTLVSVIVPLIRPAVLTLITLNFLFLWNELLFSLVLLQEESVRTIMVGIAQAQNVYQKNLTAICAGLLLSMIPPLLIFALFQRSLTRGLTSGAVK
jgi:ABC-type glycerol-3-phosphate transport system permease component